jgi:CopG family nickel-responsive transcriptional regulator
MLKRFGVSLEEDLLEDFDSYIRSRSYTNRSEAIRDLIRDTLIRREWLDGGAEVSGVVVLVYNHHQMDLSQRLTDSQHHHHTSIISTLHVHQDEHNCMEIIVLRGRAADVQHIADSLISMRGIKHGRFIRTTSGRDYT